MSRLRYVPALILGLICAGPAACDKPRMPSGSWSPYADVIFTGGEVVTVGNGFPLAKGLAIKDGKVIVVGTNDEVLAYRGPNTKVVDITGKTVIPGLQDSHIHFLSLGYDLDHSADLTFARSADDVVKAVADVKARLNPPPGAWIGGARWDQFKYPAMATRWQLDAVTPDNPVRLSRVYRGVAVNTAVFRLMGIDDNKPATWPSWWEKNPADFTSEDQILRAKRTITVNGRERQGGCREDAESGGDRDRGPRHLQSRYSTHPIDELLEDAARYASYADPVHSRGQDRYRLRERYGRLCANHASAGIHGQHSERGTRWYVLEPNGGKAAEAVVAWLQWQLRKDPHAAKVFAGKECRLCRDAAWAVDKKKMD